MNLALRHRPQCFNDVLGQDFVKNYFCNSFIKQNLTHVFLFTGTRGIGKTSLARIVAKSFNCLQCNSPSFTVCQKCENCSTIAKSNNIDVLEFDAASHTGVADIRQILESAQYNPINSRYRIYIIDEVHMLSQSAFNALLKTLEEPPAHVIFILATTEMQKIPITILSRCHIFQLRLPEENKLQNYFCQIMQKEGYELEKNAAEIIVKHSGGSVRDGLSLLEQIILTIEDKKISPAKITQILYIIDQNLLQSMLKTLIINQPQESLKIFQQLIDEGFNSLYILKNLLEYVYTNIKTVQNNFSLKELHHIWQILLKGIQNCKNNPFQKMIAEITLLQIAHLQCFESPQNLIAKIKNPTKKKIVTDNNTIKGNTLLTWKNIQEQIKFKNENLHHLIQKYITNGIIDDNKLILIFDADHDEENEMRALTIKDKITKIISNNEKKINILIKFEKRNLQNLSEKIKNNFQTK